SNSFPPDESPPKVMGERHLWSKLPAAFSASGLPRSPRRLQPAWPAPVSPTPRLNAEFFWECPACHRPYPRPEAAARCQRPPPQEPPTVAAPLVRCPELPAFAGRPLALTELAGSRASRAERAAPPPQRRPQSHPLPLLRP